MSSLPVDQCAQARSLLFVPGNRPERFGKAVQSGADAIVLDLEDSVPAAEKPLAREAIVREWVALSRTGATLVLRINACGSVEHESDLACAARLPGLAALMVPKAESAEALARLHERFADLGLLPIIESAAGHAALPSLAGVPGVIRLVLGHIDFIADTGLQPDEAETELVPLRFAIAMATRIANLAPALDGVTVQIGDDDRLRADTRRAMRFGFGGKLCIHPRQVPVVHEVLAPSEAELGWARRVIEADAASGGAAVQLDGRMVDLPVVLQAKRTLARVRRGDA